MLINFKAKNAFCFKDEAIFSLEKSKGNELKENIINDFNLLKSAVVFGPNASGKSYLFKTILLYSRFIVLSGDKNLNLDKYIQPFLLEENKFQDPIELSCFFEIDNIKYYYEYHILNNQIVYEDLSFYPKGKVANLFKRSKGKPTLISKSFDSAAKSVKDNNLCRDNSLFLSVVANLNGEKSLTIQNFFKKSFNVIYSLDFLDGPIDITSKRIEENEKFKEKVNYFIKYFDFGIKNIEIEKIKRDEPDFIKDEFKGKFKFNLDSYIKKTIHPSYDKNKKFIRDVSFDLDSDESEGTKQLYAFAYPIIDTLENGKVLFIDEFNTRLHPNISTLLVRLFNSKWNKRNAQLIINTHDTNLLDLDLFRRDQIYFTEKNKYGESSLFSLADIKGVRAEDSNVEKKYLTGMFGGLPNISESDLLNVIFND